MTYNQDFVEARAEDIFEDWVKSFFIDLTPLDEQALYSLALDTAIEESNWIIGTLPLFSMMRKHLRSGRSWKMP